MKKILAVLLSVLMLMMSMAVYATETEHVHEGCCCGEIESAAIVPEDEAVPYAERCSNCGTGTLTKKYGSFTTIQSRPCQHTAGGYDTWKIVDYYYGYVCSTSSCTNSNLNRVTHYVYQTTETLISCGNGYAVN